MILKPQNMKHVLWGAQLLLFLIISSQKMSAQQGETLKLSLREAQEFALQNNLQRKNAALDVEIAKKKVWETTAMGLPQISGGLDLTLRLDEIPKLPFGPPDPSDPEQKPTMIEIGEKFNATYKLTASQLVFSGPYIVGLQATKVYKALSENLLIKTDRDIKANVASTYYTVLLLEETNAILDSSVNNLKQTLDDTKALQKAGFVEEIVSDQVKVSLSLVENSASETARMLNSTKNLLKLQLGLETDKNIVLTERLDAMMMGFAPEAGIGSKLDPQRNIDLTLVESQVKISNLQLKLEQSNFLPNLSAYVTYQKLVNEPAINFSPTALAGASLSVPIFSSGIRRSRVQQARMELEKSRNSYDQARQSLEMELADATAQLSVAWAKYQNQMENKELANRVYENYSVKYSKGMASQQDLIQANDKYLQAVGNYTAAVVDLFNARIRVDKVLGNL
jgi:outer membrane protein TolC